MLLAVLVVGCQSSDSYDTLFTDDTVEEDDHQDELIRALQDKLDNLEEENDDLKEDNDNQDEVGESVSTVQSTKDKFDDFMDNERAVSFNSLDCSNGLENIAEDFFKGIEFTLEEQYSEDVSDLVDGDLDNIDEDLDDYESDFTSIDWDLDLENTATSGLSSQFENVTFFSAEVTDLFNATSQRLNDIEDSLDDAQDKLEDDEDYEDAVDDFDDARDEIENLEDDIKDLKDFLNDLEDELNDNNFDDEADDVKDVSDDVEKIEDDIESLDAKIDDLSDNADELAVGRKLRA